MNYKNFICSSIYDNYRFWKIIFCEFLFWIPLVIWEYINKYTSLRIKNNITPKLRTNVNEGIYVSIHDWGGYSLNRIKKLKNGVEFACGLKPQLEFYRKYKGQHKLTTIVTLSDANKSTDVNWIKNNSDLLLEVNNDGFDFSGYEAAYSYVNKIGNHYIILSNSSINSNIDNYLDDYIQYMDMNLDVGLLGISMSLNFQQTLIRNNFRPHIQSFFILTTTEVLSEIIKLNSDCFPGKGINHKLLLIREGEIKISQLTLNLGYKLAVVQKNGCVIKFGRKNKRDNCYSSLYNIHIDNRMFIKDPNKINQILHSK